MYNIDINNIINYIIKLMNSSRIGILGGSFNPPTIGH
jgi:hypothetical protein